MLVYTAFNNTFTIQRIYITIIINISMIVGVHNDKLNYQWPLMRIIPDKLNYRQRLLAFAIAGKFDYHIFIRCALRRIESFRFIQTCNFANIVSFNKVSFHVPYLSLSLSSLPLDYPKRKIYFVVYSVSSHIHRMSTHDEISSSSSPSSSSREWRPWHVLPSTRAYICMPALRFAW